MASPQLVQPPQQQQQQQPQPQQQPFQPYRSPGSVLLYESNSDVSYIIAEHGCLCCLTPAAEFVVGTSKVQVFTDYVYSVSSWDKTEFLKAWMRAAGPQIEETMSNVRTIQFDSVKREDILAVRSADSNASYVVAKQDSMCSDCLLCLCSLGLSLCVHMCNKPPVLIKQTGYKVPLTLTLRTKDQPINFVVKLDEAETMCRIIVASHHIPVVATVPLGQPGMAYHTNPGVFV